MSVSEYKSPSSLKIRLSKGMDLETSKEIFKTRTYQRLKNDASTQDVFEVGNCLAGLTDNEGVKIFKQDLSEIRE